jgi:magnesium transporter
MLTLPFLHHPPHSSHLISDQVIFVLGPQFVATIQSTATPLFDAVHQQIFETPEIFTSKGADFLMSVLLGAVGDACFWSIEMLRIRSEELEQAINTDGPIPPLLRAIRQHTRQFLTFRQALDPFPMFFEKFFDPGSPFVSSQSRPQFTEILDRARHLSALLDGERDIVMSLHDTYRASQGDRMNTTVNQLTMLLSVFIPLSFLTGIWGMNFEYMPELQWKLGYPFALMLMIMVVISLLVYFRKKKLW